MDIKKVVAANVKLFRAHRGLTQEQLGKKANMHPVYIAGIEGGTRNATLANLSKIATALDIPPYLLLSEEIKTWLKNP